MAAREEVVVRRLSNGKRSQEVRFGRFLANDKVTVERLIEGWSEQTRSAVRGRHVLALQDTSEINFKTIAERRRGLGEIGKGSGRGVLLHAMLAVDATTRTCLGLVAGRVWTRQGRVSIPHGKRQLKDKESERWVATPEAAKEVLAEATAVTVIDDREGDIYVKWARLPAANFHLISRVMHDRALADGGSLYDLGQGLPAADSRIVRLPARSPQRPARDAQLTLRFTPVKVRRPQNTVEADLPDSVALTLVEVIELNPPADVEPIHWRLLTTHAVATSADAWRIVDWYTARWIIEQLFRVMKTQGLNVEDSQIETADRLLKLVAIAAKAATVNIQLVQARDGPEEQPASLVFSDDEIDALAALDNRLKGKTKLQINPHRYRSLAWAAWIIARLGGWDGYPSSKKPGPITFRNGFQHFQSIAVGWNLKNVCMP
jgi:hypothetical protein